MRNATSRPNTSSSTARRPSGLLALRAARPEPAGRRRRPTLLQAVHRRHDAGRPGDRRRRRRASRCRTSCASSAARSTAASTTSPCCSIRPSRWTALAPQPQWNGKVRLHLRCVHRPAAPAVPHRAELGRRLGAVARLHGRRQQPDRFALQLEPDARRRDDDDDEGAHRRHTTARSCTRWATAARAARSSRTRSRRSSRGCSTASSRAATTPTRSPPASRSPTACCSSTSTSSPQWPALMAGLTQAQINAKKTAINGHLDQLGCQSWNNSFGFNNKPGNYVPTLVVDQTTGAIAPFGAPRNNCLLPAALVYDPVTNPTGTRCGDPDLAVAVWGTDRRLAAGTLRALQTNDNVGIQYGLKALLVGRDHARGVRNAEREDRRLGPGLEPQRSALGRRPGGAGHRLQRRHRVERQEPRQGRRSSTRAAMTSRASTTSGAASRNGPGSTPPRRRPRQPGDLALRHRSPARDAGADCGGDDEVVHDDGHVADDPDGAARRSRCSTPSARTPRSIAAKPAAAIDFCFLTGDVNFATPVTDQRSCDADPRLVSYASPHQVAGGPLAENILKCQLKPLAFSDYTGITFTAGQQARLNVVSRAAYATGASRALASRTAISPLTFAAGPGGQPLPPAPTAEPRVH